MKGNKKGTKSAGNSGGKGEPRGRGGVGKGSVKHNAPENVKQGK